MKTLREKLLAKRPPLRSFVIDDDTFYLRDVTVGDINFEINRKDTVLESLAKQKGMAVPEDEEGKKALYVLLVEQYSTAMNIARYLSNEAGELLFSVEMLDDLDAINSLPRRVLQALDSASEKPKN